MRSADLFEFISARHSIWQRRQGGAPKPWTDNTLLKNYRFCNVYREYDKVTLWINHNWRTPNNTDKDLWFAMAVARLFNLPSTLEAIGYPVPFLRDHIREELGLLEDANTKIFNPAYIVSTNGRALNKVDYLIQYVLEPMWKIRDVIRPVQGECLADFYKRLQSCMGMGSFMAAQVVADIKYAPVLLKAEDWWTFAASGPGSRRGLNRVYGHFVDNPWRERVWYDKLLNLKLEIDKLVKKNNMPPLHAQDLQNCLCEFDKFERVRLGEGVPKQRYDGC